MLKAKDIMSLNVASIPYSATVAEAVQLMKYKKVWALFVESRPGDRQVGVVTKEDIVYKVAAFGHNPNTMRVREIMTRPCVMVQPEMDIECVARLFLNTSVPCAPVIADRPLGIISASEIKANFCVEQAERLCLYDEIDTTGAKSVNISHVRSDTTENVRRACMPALK